MLIIGISRGEIDGLPARLPPSLSRECAGMDGGAMKTNNPRRHLVQLLATYMTNPHVSNFADGTIHKGKSKSFYSPGLSYYSCLTFSAQCYLNFLQSVENGNKYHISYYVMGFC